MSPMLISTVVGLAITVMALGQVAPSVRATLFAKATETGVGREEALVQQILQYRTVEGLYPASVADLVAKNYWRATDNTNGFGGSYTFTIDAAKGLIAVSTTIADPGNRAQYLVSPRHVFKPVEQSGNVILTTFVMPNSNALGSPSTGSIPVSSTAPSAASNTYWYDTSGSTAVMKVSNGSGWLSTTTASSGGGTGAGGIAAAAIVTSANDLPITATAGDVRYIYNAANATLDTLTYYNGAWTQALIATPPVVSATPSVTALSAQTLPVGRVASAFFFDFKAAVSAMYVGTLAALTVDTSKVVWAIQGMLPAGLSLNAATGVLAGTPTAKTAPAGSTFNVLATYNGGSGLQSYLIKVGPSYLWVKSISAGQLHTCAVTKLDGVKCWGNNAVGQLGDDTKLTRTIPVDVYGLTSGVLSMSAGGLHTCAVTKTAGVRCWGINSNGQLGNGSMTQSLTPVLVTGTDTAPLSNIASGRAHTCAMTSASGVKCWGWNGYGQLGESTLVDRTTPTAVFGLASGVASIEAGAIHTCAVLNTGGVQCWGDNGSGQIGNGGNPSLEVMKPANVTSLSSGVLSVSAGDAHTCAVTASAVKCWGSNDKGQLGNGSTATSVTPVTVSVLSSGVKSVSAGGTQTCAITAANGAMCWGNNANGQLGNGSTATSSIPVDVTGLAVSVSSISAGTDHTCAVTTEGATKCWGNNGNSRLGDGTVVQKNAPVDVFVEAW